VVRLKGLAGDEENKKWGQNCPSRRPLGGQKKNNIEMYLEE